MAKRVLIVEDNALNLKLFTDLLRAHTFDVEPLSDGKNAQSVAREFKPDLVIMDIQLPGISGLDLIEEIRRDAQLGDVPVLAVTAYAGTGDEDRILSAGASAYVSKPVSVMPFLEKVKGLV